MRAMMNAAMTTLALALMAGTAFAKMPPPTEEAKAKAAEAAAKTAWSDKVAAFQLCRAQDRVADKYRTTAPTLGKQAPQPLATQPCVDPGPFAVATKPLEAAGAHSPADTAKGPPSTNATAAEIQGGVKKN